MCCVADILIHIWHLTTHHYPLHYLVSTGRVVGPPDHPLAALDRLLRFTTRGGAQRTHALLRADSEDAVHQHSAISRAVQYETVEV